MNCGRHSKRLSSVPLSRQSNGARVSIICSRQTAESFAGAAASSTAAALFQDLRLHHNLEIIDVVLKVAAYGLDEFTHRLSGQ